MKVLIIALLILAAVIAAAATSRTEDVTASSGGASPVPLVSCPNLDADSNGYVRAGDISRTVKAFFHDAPRPAFAGDPDAFPYKIDGDYVFLYDRNADGILRAADISNVVQAFFTTCPLIDTQIAQATQWVLSKLEEQPPINLIVENPSVLSSLGYIGGGQDVPGQGKHYLKLKPLGWHVRPGGPRRAGLQQRLPGRAALRRPRRLRWLAGGPALGHAGVVLGRNRQRQRWPDRRRRRRLQRTRSTHAPAARRHRYRPAVPRQLRSL